MIVNLYIVNVKLIVLCYDTFTCTFLYWIRAVKFLNPMLLSEVISRIFKTKIKKNTESMENETLIILYLPCFYFFKLILLEYVCVLSHFSQVQLSATPWTMANQAPLSMGFSRQEYWNGLPFPFPVIKHEVSEMSKVKLLSRVQLFATPWTIAYQAPPSMGFSRQEYWSGVPFPPPLLEYICFTMLYSFLLYSKMNPPYIYIHSLPIGQTYTTETMHKIDN